jgi:hypothetical protein
VDVSTVGRLGQEVVEVDIEIGRGEGEPVDGREKSRVAGNVDVSSDTDLAKHALQDGIHESSPILKSSKLVLKSSSLLLRD